MGGLARIHILGILTSGINSHIGRKVSCCGIVLALVDFDAWRLWRIAVDKCVIVTVFNKISCIVSMILTPRRFRFLPCGILVAPVLLNVHGFVEFYKWLSFTVTVSFINFLLACFGFLGFELVLNVITIWLQYFIFLSIRDISIFKSRNNFLPPKIIHNHLYRHFGLIIPCRLWKIAKKLLNHRFWIFVYPWIFKVKFCKIFLRNLGR